MSIDALLKSALVDTARSRQVAIGPSEVGDCRRRVALRLAGNERPNESSTLRLSSWMGTAIHTALEASIRFNDPFSERYLTEVEVRLDDPPLLGHVDVYDMQEAHVIDWKTITKKKVSVFPEQQKQWQIMLYAYMLKEVGMPVEQVSLVGIPRDGDERDIVVWTREYDPSIVDQALAWLERVRQGDATPDKRPSFCTLYCPYFDESGVVGCAGKSD